VTVSDQDDVYGTPLLKAIMALAPGETRVLQATSSDPPPGHARFLKISGTSRYAQGFVRWENKPFFEFGRPPPPRPPFLLTGKSAVPFSTLEQKPILVSIDESDRPIPHIHLFGLVYLITQQVLDSLLALDPDSIDILPVDIDEPPLPTQFYLCIFVRAMDPVDTRYTTVEILNEALPGNNDPVYIRKCHCHTGYTVRDDIPSNIHAIWNGLNGDLLFSRELIGHMRAHGVVGVNARKTEGHSIWTATVIEF
jgi:hypothetical protein